MFGSVLGRPGDRRGWVFLAVTSRRRQRSRVSEVMTSAAERARRLVRRLVSGFVSVLLASYSLLTHTEADEIVAHVCSDLHKHVREHNRTDEIETGSSVS